MVIFWRILFFLMQGNYLIRSFDRFQEHSRKGTRGRDKDKDDREGGTKSRRDRGSSARKARAAHGAPSPPPSVTPAEDEKRLV